jgi:Tfp pilus assembly PilM family ATPase
VNDQFISEYQMSVDFFFQSGEAPVGKDKIEGAFLTGGGALLLGLYEYMQTKLETPIVLLDPFQNVQISPRMRGKENLNYSSMFSVCAGLGLRRLKEE